MPVWRMQCEFQMDTAFPRDVLMINPHFNDGQGVILDTGVDDLCQDLADALFDWRGQAGQITVTAYDAQGTIPVIPQGTATAGGATIPNSVCCRELALCLSFRSGASQPRKRGRLFIPAAFLGSSSVPVRPTSGQMTQVAALVPYLTNLGSTDIDWGVYSRVNDEFYAATDWWVDDEWDIIRSRGMRPTTRQTTPSLDPATSAPAIDESTRRAVAPRCASLSTWT